RPPWWAKTGLPAGMMVHPQHHRSTEAPRMVECFSRDSTYGGDGIRDHDNDNSDYSGHREQQPRRRQWWTLSHARSPGRIGMTAAATNSGYHGWQQHAHSGGAFSGNGGGGGGGGGDGICAAELEVVRRIGSGPPTACRGTLPTIVYNSHDRSSSLWLSTRPFPERTQWRSNVRANVAPRAGGGGGGAA
ncbi:unnamed protein product, partial [Ectocarpus sp. 13 AM-2016]